MKKSLLTLSFVFLTAGVSFSQSLNDSLKLYYRFNGNANDVSGNGNHGTVVGAVLTKGILGADSTAYAFDDLGDQIQFPADNMLGIEYSYSLWFKAKKPVSQGNAEGIFSFGGSACQHVLYRANNYVGNYGLIADGTATDFSPFFANDPNLPDTNVWIHVVAVKSSDSIKLFVNGQQVAANETPNQDPCYQGNVKSGTLGRAIGFSFIGAMDEVRIYTRPLSGTEVAGLYNMELTSFGSDDVQLKCRVYPNPSKNREVYLDVEAEIQEVTVYDLQGKLTQTEFISGEKKIRLTELAAGTYILHVHTNEGVIRERIILQ